MSDEKNTMKEASKYFADFIECIFKLNISQFAWAFFLVILGGLALSGIEIFYLTNSLFEGWVLVVLLLGIVVFMFWAVFSKLKHFFTILSGLMSLISVLVGDAKFLRISGLFVAIYVVGGLVFLSFDIAEKIFKKKKQKILIFDYEDNEQKNSEVKKDV